MAVTQDQQHLGGTSAGDDCEPFLVGASAGLGAIVTSLTAVLASDLRPVIR